MQRTAQANFLARTTGGATSYRRALGEAFTTTVGKLGGRKGARIFVEKVPRNGLIADHLPEMAPDSKFLFLWRNPLHIVSSMIDTWSKDEAWPRTSLNVDLFDSLQGTLRLFKALPDSRRSSTTFERFVSAPQATMDTIWEWLDVRGASDIATTSLPVLQERDDAGDPTFGSSAVEVVTRDRRPVPLRGGVRERQIRCFLSTLSDSDLSTMGYSRPALLDELECSDRAGLRMYALDFWAHSRSVLARKLMIHMTNSAYGSRWQEPAVPR